MARKGPGSKGARNTKSYKQAGMKSKMEQILQLEAKAKALPKRGSR